MKLLVQDFATHPLVPGCLLASIVTSVNARKFQALDATALTAFNQMGTPDIAAHFQTLGALDETQRERLISADAQFMAAYQEIAKGI
ncbi:MAG: hypothetical protein HY043_15305, partial [Verrucomicrobia bacterium]|nr:hypothetical protein [Verrucomicrobiota bacterium]